MNAKQLLIESLERALLKAEAALAERDEAITLAYRLWLQRAFDDIGEVLAPLSVDLRARAKEGTG